MVEFKSQRQLDRIFQALADSTRRSMLESLKEGEKSIVELAEPFAMTLAGAAKHVQVLDRAKLISRRKEGRTQYCQLNAAAFEQAQQWFERYSAFWNTRLDDLEKLLAAERMKIQQGESES